MIGVLGLVVTTPVLTLGLLTGITYGLLAAGLVIVFRSSRIVNFAHGEIGALGAAVLGLAVVKWHVPYWVALPFALAVSCGAGAGSELLVVRRFRRAPAVMSIVATLGVAQFLLALSLALNNQVTASRLFPQPPGLPQFHIGALLVTRAYSGMLLLSPLLIAALAAFLRYSTSGLAIRAAADNSGAARTSGISVNRMSMMSWAIAGGLSAFTAILVFPTQGFVTSEALGPALLLRALVPAVLARMTSLPIALGSGVVVGVLEQELLANYPRGGFVEPVLLGVILVVLLLQPRQRSRESEGGAWLAVAPWRPIPQALRRTSVARNIGLVGAVVGGAVALGLALLVSNGSAVKLAIIVTFALVGLSVGVVTGLAGQISLGQFAIAGVGAGGAYWVVHATGNFLLAFVCAGLCGAAVSVIVGLPAIRIRGLMLAVTTLGLALSTESWLFSQRWFFGAGRVTVAPTIFGLHATTGRALYVFSLVPLALGIWLVRNCRRSGIGRQFRAVRDNEDAARAFTVPASRVKLKAFALAGFVAGLGGATFGGLVSFVSADVFPIKNSIDVVALSALGGIEVLVGPLLGALYVMGIPSFLPLDSAGLAATSLGWLLLIMYFPGGLAQAARPVRDRIVARLGDRTNVRLPGEEQPEEAGDRAQSLIRRSNSTVPRSSTSGVLLRVSDVAKQFSGHKAVDRVSFSVNAGEILGLIGPNGAGKTTLFDLISGFIRSDSGQIALAGRDISHFSPEERGRLGLIRSFQDATLFPTMTAQETVELALERQSPSRMLSGVLGLSGREERKKQVQAREVLHLMGLGRYEDHLVGELSTGTRRILEMACLVALGPQLLLLDEPSSGIAQRETEMLGELLLGIKAHLDTTMVIIEHDMPLIMGLSDRIVALSAGQVIAIGPPAEVRLDPLVVESYLGGNPLALSRSGQFGTQPSARCTVVTDGGQRCSRAASEAGLCASHMNTTVSTND